MQQFVDWQGSVYYAQNTKPQYSLPIKQYTLPAQQNEVEDMAAQYPEIKKEIEAIEIAMEKYAFDSSTLIKMLS